MELFSKPGVGGIIEKSINRDDYILLQQRYKEGAEKENGLLEIPAGKIREFENIFDCLRREIKEETGLIVTHIEGEKEAIIVECNGYKVLNYTPFSSSQNLIGSYPIMVQVFLCKASGELLKESNESQNLKWVSVAELKKLLEEAEERFYPMHITALKKYVKFKLNL